MPLFQFRQNNSGGRWIGPKNVVIQADNAADANDIAQNSRDIYFNGVVTVEKKVELGLISFVWKFII